MMSQLVWLITILSMVVGIACFTLLERKVLSYVQQRKGPKKVGFLGLLQPFADAFKLMGKFTHSPFKSKAWMYWVSPALALTLTLLSWSIIPSFWSKWSYVFGMIFFLCLSGFHVYSVLGSGWASKSKYALLGGLRGAAQTMSYEVALVFVLLFPCCFQGSFNLWSFFESYWVYCLVFLPGLYLWLFCLLAETHRAPFDFAEGESELVSGFNVEYGGLAFAFLFLSEYGNILLAGVFTGLLFCCVKSFFTFVLFGLGFSFVFMWVRSTFPRWRYDQLMHLAWKVLLPVSLFFLFLVLSSLSNGVLAH